MVYLGLIFFILGVDFISKEYVKKRLPLSKRQELVKGRFFLWHIENRGVAYSLFAGHPKKVLGLTGTALFLLAFTLFKFYRAGESAVKKTAVSMLLAGGLGNFIDRAKNGSVTDFLYIEGKKAPIFNIADVVILFGGILLFLQAFFTKEGGQ